MLSPPPQSSSSSTVPAATPSEATNGKVVMDYSTDFPKLPETKAPTNAAAGAWARRPLMLATVTEKMTLSVDERAAMNLGSKTFGSAEQQKCAQVASATNTKIELCESANKALTILITGKRADVDNAHDRLSRELQTQASIEVTVPREYYGAIIGKDGAKRKQLETEYRCRFYMPRRDEDSEIVRIVGPMDQVKQAANRLREIVTELAKQATETLEIPKSFYPWIRGINNEIVDRIAAETGAKINMPPPRSNNEVVVVSGEREGVGRAVAELRALYEAKKNVKSVTCKVARAQHRFIVGQQRSGLDEIFRQTEVVVTVPPEEENSDTITLRGPEDRLGDALTHVYTRASSIISVELKYPEWQRKFLLGPKGATLQQLVPKQDSLNVEFEDGGTIFIEGPPEAVKNASAALRAEIDRLTEEMAIDVVKVKPYLHRHIIGRQGALISKIKNDHDVRITIPDERKGSDEIRIEGRKEAVQAAANEIREHAAKLEKKIPEPSANGEPQKPTEEIVRLSMEVDPRYHKHFVIRGAAVIQEIQQKHPGAIISFPRADAENSSVHVRGPKTAAEGAVETIAKTVADLVGQEEDRRLRSYKTQVDVPLAYHARLIGPGGATIRDLSKRFDSNINIPRDQTETIVITGYEERANAAKAEIERLVDDWANRVTHSVSLDPRFHPRLIGQKRKNLRTIETEYKVEINIPNRGDEDPTRVLVSGRDEEAVLNCIDKLRILEEDYMQDVVDSTRYEYKRQPTQVEPKRAQQVEITGAPWQLDSHEQFPSMGENGLATANKPSTGVWGRRH